MSTGHTPGPWRYKPHSVDSNYMLIFCSNDPHEGDNLRGYCGEANARLIAASPDLYAVLKELQESAAYWSEYDVPLGIVDRINQAIAKAEGTK